MNQSVSCTVVVLHIGEVKNSLFKYFGVYVGHISYKQGSSVEYQNVCFWDLLLIQSEMFWFFSRTDQTALHLRIQFLYSFIICEQVVRHNECNKCQSLSNLFCQLLTPLHQNLLNQFDCCKNNKLLFLMLICLIFSIYMFSKYLFECEY